jgi:hypothetical protein
MKTFYNIVRDTNTGLYSKMSLFDFLNGGYLVGIEKRNPFLESVDSLLSKKEATKKVRQLNQQDI